MPRAWGALGGVWSPVALRKGYGRECLARGLAPVAARIRADAVTIGMDIFGHVDLLV